MFRDKGYKTHDIELVT